MAEVQSFAGLKELQEALKQLPDRIAKNVLRGAVSAGAAVVRKQVVANAPLWTGPVGKGHPKPGTLKKSIYQKQIGELSNNVKQTFFVGARRGKGYREKGQDAYYASWVEFGHFFVPPRPKGVTRKAHRKENRSKFVPAHPFIRPAFESKKVEAVEAIKAYLEKRIPDEVAKLPGAKK